MTTGIETYDENGKLQFNGDMLTYACRLSGTTYVENRKLANTCYTSFLIPTSQTYSEALIAVSGGNGYAAAFGGTYHFGDGTYQRIYGTNGAPAGTPFNYFIFEKSSTIPAINFGLEVRRESTNEITFSTSQRVMRCLDVFGGVVNSGEQQVHYPGRQLAFCQAAWAGHRISGPKQYYGGNGQVIRDWDNPGDNLYSGWQNDGKIYGGLITDGGQTVRTRMCSWDDVYIGPWPDEPQPPDFFNPLNLFVIDVTGVPIGQQFY